MKKLLLSIVSAFLLFALSAQVSDDFSDYTVGGKLAQQAQAQGRDYWTTWSNAPGGSEDGVIAEQPVGNKCLKLIAPNQDQILRLGDKNGNVWDPKTSGVWELTFKIFIPTGKDGYFNIKNTFPSTVSETWAMQIYMGTDEGDPGPATPGVGKIYGGASDGINFNFSHNTWVPIKIFIDLDDDVAEFYVNNTLVHTYQYSKGSFGQSNHRYIAAFNIFPPNTAATSEFYIDDVVFAQAQTAEVLFATNFDELAAGSYVAQAYPTWFETWGEAPGTSEDALVTTEQAQTNPHSAKCTWGTDLVFLAGDKTYGAYTIDFDIYFPNNGRGYLNLLQVFDRGNNGQDSEWAIGVYFNVTATGMPPGTNIRQNNILTPFTFPFETWFPISFYVNLDDDIATISINGEQKLQWQYSLLESGGDGIRQLAAADFYPPQAGSTYYIDNFKFTALSSGDTWPIMNVTPTEISEIIVPGANVTKTITVANTGTSVGDYFSWIEFDLENPPSGSDIFTLTHSSDTYSGSGLAFAQAGYAEFGVRFSSNDVCDKIGSYITKMSHYLAAEVENNTLTFRIYKGATSNATGELLTEFVKTNVIPGTWTEITLPDPVLITGELWLSVSYIQLEVNGAIYPIGHDNTSQKPGVNWFKRSSEASTWTKFWDDSNYGNLMIKATAEGGTIPACWITLTGDTYGSVPKNSSKTFNVVLNALGLEEGEYTATIFVSTTDVDNPLFTIPCTIEVASGPFMSINITSISEHIFIDGITTSISKTITVSNNGNESGNYTATIEGTATSWLELTGDVSATVPAGANKTFNAVLEAAGLQPNTYNATIVITTTDNNNPKFEIPCTLIASLGIDDYKIQTLVFPNPAGNNQTITVQSNTFINSIQVFNNMGQLVYTTSVNDDKTTINISNYTAGIYIMKIHTEAGSQSVKLFVK